MCSKYVDVHKRLRILLWRTWFHNGCSRHCHKCVCVLLPLFPFVGWLFSFQRPSCVDETRLPCTYTSACQSVFHSLKYFLFFLSKRLYYLALSSSSSILRSSLKTKKKKWIVVGRYKMSKTKIIDYWKRRQQWND